MTATTRCLHHWIIAPQRSQYSEGICRICGETRLFDNWIHDNDHPPAFNTKTPGYKGVTSTVYGKQGRPA